MLQANKYAEDMVTQQYGREIFHKPTSREVDELLEQGYKAYVTKFGRTPKTYILDKGTAEFLERVTTPEAYGSIIRNWEKFHGYWKARATVLRPGFMARNVLGGNILQMWLADVKMSRAPWQAFAATYKASKRMGADLATLATGRKLASGAKKAGKAKVGKYTLDEAVDLGLEYGVQLGEQSSVELKNIAKFRDEWTMRRGTWKKAKLAASLINPVGAKNIIMRGVTKGNRFGENWARWSVWLDRLAKGYAPKAAIADVAKFVFNVNEASQFVKGAAHAMSFVKWNWKNWGMQFTTLMNKPDKYLNFLHAYYGIQGLDPLDHETFENMPDWVLRQMGYAVPYVRGPEGKRKFVYTADIFPIFGTADLQPHRIAAAAGELTNPLIRETLTYILMAEMGLRPTYYRSIQEAPEQYVRVPDWISKLMDHARTKYPVFWEFVAKKLVHPLPASGGYKWHIGIDRNIQLAEPGIGLFNRIFRHADSRAYDAGLAAVFGVKVKDLGNDTVEFWRRDVLGEIRKEFEKDIHKYKQLEWLPSGPFSFVPQPQPQP
jgi:hypothetical protein